MSETETETPVGLVVNLEARVASEQRGVLAAAIADATTAGDLPRVQTLAAQLEELLAQQGELVTAPVEQTLELTADQVAVLATVQAEAFEQIKARKTVLVQAALDATNGWVAEAFENGAQLSDEQKSYRDSLRALFPEIDAATEVAAIDAIEIPDPPSS